MIALGPKLLILAGGFGTRLQPANLGVPKVLAPANGHPFLELQIINWINQGIRSFVFILHYEADKVIDFLKRIEETLLLGIEIAVLVEPKPLGTGGAVAFALKRLSINDDFFVTNGDTWLTSGVKALREVESPSIAVVKVSNCARYGQVKFDSTGRVMVFKEKANVIEPGWIYAGLSKLSPSIFQGMGDDIFSLEERIISSLALSKKLIAVPVTSEFIDIGVPEDYERFCHWIGNNSEGSL
jgi:D-glycero-alpha-D-manno-heptose 1-phosphate guanylyltransferase